MKVQENWRQRNYMLVATELRHSTKNIEEVFNELGYNEKEKQILRWLFIG